MVTAVYTVIDTFTKPDNQVFNYIHGIAFQGNQYGYAMAMYIIYLLALAAMLGIVMFVVARAMREDR